MYRNQNINKMKTAIIYSVFFLSALITSVGLVTTIEEHPRFAIILTIILICVLAIMAVIRLLDDRENR